MSDKRTVSTDALETLGTIIDENQKRDAIHLAVEPVVAARFLNAGDHVDIRDGVAHLAQPGSGMGIVDPFLVEQVKPGQRFWFVMYPRQVTSLRHVWSHPAFPDEPGTPAASAADKTASERWLREFCERSDSPSYERLMEAIQNGDVGEWGCFVGNDSGATGEIPPQLWDHVEIVTGRKMDHRPSYFSCSC